MKFTGQSLESYSSKSVTKKSQKISPLEGKCRFPQQRKTLELFGLSLGRYSGSLGFSEKRPKDTASEVVEYVKKVYKGSHRFFFHDNKTPRKRVTGQVKSGRKSENQTEKIR